MIDRLTVKYHEEVVGILSLTPDNKLDAEYGVAWLGKKESDDAIHRLDSSLKKLCGPFFQPFFERNDTIKDWWDK